MARAVTPKNVLRVMVDKSALALSPFLQEEQKKGHLVACEMSNVAC